MDNGVDYHLSDSEVERPTGSQDRINNEKWTNGTGEQVFCCV